MPFADTLDDVVICCKYDEVFFEDIWQWLYVSKTGWSKYPNSRSVYLKTMHYIPVTDGVYILLNVDLH